MRDNKQIFNNTISEKNPFSINFFTDSMYPLKNDNNKSKVFLYYLTS